MAEEVGGGSAFEDSRTTGKGRSGTEQRMPSRPFGLVVIVAVGVLLSLPNFLEGVLSILGIPSVLPGVLLRAPGIRDAAVIATVGGVALGVLLLTTAYHAAYLVGYVWVWELDGRGLKLITWMKMAEIVLVVLAFFLYLFAYTQVPAFRALEREQPTNLGFVYPYVVYNVIVLFYLDSKRRYFTGSQKR